MHNRTRRVKNPLCLSLKNIWSDWIFNYPKQGSDDEREYLTLEELKPHQLTELGLANHQPVVTQQTSTIPQINPSGQANYGNPHIVYYDLNTQQPTMYDL